MAQMYYTLEEAIAKLGCDEAALKSAVRDGKLREFRDAGKSNYKVDEIDKLASSGELGGGSLADEPELSASMGPIELADTGNPMPDLSSGGSIGIGDTGLNLAGTAAGLSGTGTDLGLSLGDSGIDLAGGDDMVSLDEVDSSTEGTSPGKAKDDTVVSSVGVSVFDEEDLDESADPMAKTVMSGTSSGTGLEGVGSGGSGLLDLTRESDDTSLGAELLDEIYPGDDAPTMEMGDATRAGLEGTGAGTAAGTEAGAEAFEEVADTPAASATVTVRTVEYAADSFSHGVTGLVAVGLLVMCVAGLALASMIRGLLPSILELVFGKLWMFGVGALVIAGAAMGLGMFLGKRSDSS